jgi:hypothetical protein
LRGLAVAQAVEPQLTHDERTITGERVQPCQIGDEPLARLEVDVETEEIEERKFQVFRRRIVDVRHQRRRILALHGVVELVQEARDGARTVPPDDRRRDLVADREGEQRGMIGAPSRVVPQSRDDLARALGVVEEGQVRRPPEARQHAEIVGGGDVERPQRRRHVGPHRVEAGSGHGGEVSLHGLAVGEVAVVGPRPKRSVGDAPDPEPAIADVDELAMRPGAQSCVHAGGKN